MASALFSLSWFDERGTWSRRRRTIVFLCVCAAAGLAFPFLWRFYIDKGARDWPGANDVIVAEAEDATDVVGPWKRQSALGRTWLEGEIKSMRFHGRYDGNCLVNAMAVGLAEKDKIFYAAASGVGMPIVYLGSKTGRDGIHGASMASAEFGADTEEKRPTVQVGDPFAEKLLLEACLEIMAKGCVIAIQDMGAAGLTCSAVDQGRNGGPSV